jgi:hypothetical protein
VVGGLNTIEWGMSAGGLNGANAEFENLLFKKLAALQSAAEKWNFTNVWVKL